ncbi:hypothetical protein HK098_004989 [Nowakowskiella sp. JEL0407]|nr:hypothetical protein HK098_004989 [Nowakowskiella sp. JEL0407]
MSPNLTFGSVENPDKKVRIGTSKLQLNIPFGTYTWDESDGDSEDFVVEELDDLDFENRAEEDYLKLESLVRNYTPSKIIETLPKNLFPLSDSPLEWNLVENGQHINVAEYVGSLVNSDCYYDPIHFGVVRLGIGIRRPVGMEKNIWKAIRSSVDTKTFAVQIPRNLEKQILDILNTKSKNLFQELLEDISITDPMTRFFKKGLDFINTLVFQGTDMDCLNGEILSSASAKMRFERRQCKVTDNPPYGQKVDGLFIHEEYSVECGRVELSGPISETSKPRYIKDHIRGTYLSRDMLDVLARDERFNKGSMNVFRELKIVFLQTFNQHIELWYTNWATKGLYRMILVNCCELPKDWKSKSASLSFLWLMWTMRNIVEDTCEHLQTLFNETQMLYQADTNLKNLLPSHNVWSPQKAGISKGSRNVLPIQDYSSE